MQEGKLFGVVLNCEKIINKIKYLVSFTIKKDTKSLSVIIEAQPLLQNKTPTPGKYSLFEVCTILDA